MGDGLLAVFLIAPVQTRAEVCKAALTAARESRAAVARLSAGWDLLARDLLPPQSPARPNSKDCTVCASVWRFIWAKSRTEISVVEIG